jgi:hypothetical protein
VKGGGVEVVGRMKTGVNTELKGYDAVRMWIRRGRRRRR